MKNPPQTEAEFLERFGTKNVSYKALFQATDMLIAAIKPLKLQIEAQAGEIAALKARPLQKWAGVHIAGVKYAEASLVTKGGSLWAAMTATTTTPGDPGGDWRLIVKRGSV